VLAGLRNAPLRTILDSHGFSVIVSQEIRFSLYFRELCAYRRVYLCHASSGRPIGAWTWPGLRTFEEIAPRGMQGPEGAP